MYSKIWAKTDIFKVIPKKHLLSQNIDIYGFLDKILLLRSDLKNWILPKILILTDLWTKKDFFKMISKNVFNTRVDNFG